jgi:hypothetical protein
MHGREATMKVRTDLQAGNMIDDLNQQVNEISSTVQGWLKNVNNQADQIGSWATGQLGRVDELRRCILNV